MLYIIGINVAIRISEMVIVWMTLFWALICVHFRWIWPQGIIGLLYLGLLKNCSELNLAVEVLSEFTLVCTGFSWNSLKNNCGAFEAFLYGVLVCDLFHWKYFMKKLSDLKLMSFLLFSLAHFSVKNFTLRFQELSSICLSMFMIRMFYKEIFV